jgi:hypothetical protein
MDNRAMKLGFLIWFTGFGFGLTETFYLDEAGLLQSFVAKLCDAAASLTMATGLVVFILAAVRGR